MGWLWQVLGLEGAGCRGRRAEERVARELAAIESEGVIMSFNDVLLNVNGKPSQMDHIVVSTRGIFVIETKNYLGLVFGRASDRYLKHWVLWRCHRFYNPLRQNANHVKNLKRKFNWSPAIGATVMPLTVFSRRSIINIKGAQTPILRPEKVAAYILSQPERLRGDDVLQISNEIKAENLTDDISRQWHIDFVRRIADKSNR